MSSAKDPDLVLVEWQDSCSPGRKWHDRSSADTYYVATCRSVGWLLRHDRKVLVLAASTCDPTPDGKISDEIGDMTAIPSACIVSVKKLVPSRVRNSTRKVLRDPKKSKRAKVARGESIDMG